MDTDRPATYNYGELADRIEQVLGERPSLSALRAAAAKARVTSSTQSMPRLTAGMPPPLPARSRTSPAEFSIEEVESWLKNHPRLVQQDAQSALAAELSRGGDIDQAVQRARDAGLSWRRITETLTMSDGQPRSVAGVHKRFRRS